MFDIVITDDDDDNNGNSEDKKAKKRSAIKSEEKQIMIDDEQVTLIQFIIDEEETENLIRLVSILAEDGDLNLTATHYMTEIIGSFISNDDVQLEMLKFIYSNDRNLDLLIKHIGETCIFNLVRKILNMDSDNDKSDLSFLFLYHKLLFHYKIFDALLTTEDDFEIDNIADLYVELLESNKESEDNNGMMESKGIMDGSFYIDKIFFDEKRYQRLLDTLSKSVSV